jgi:hypothetical protein
MSDTITYFGNPVRATYPNGDPIIMNGRFLLIPENFSLQNEINAAHYAASRYMWYPWSRVHYALGSSGDPQRQAGYSGGFDPRYTDAGNYAFGLSAAAAGLRLDDALGKAAEFNKAGTGKPLPAANENAIRQGFGDYAAKRFPNVDHDSGWAYIKSTWPKDVENPILTGKGFINPPPRIAENDVERYAKEHWGDLNSPGAQAFMANFQPAFERYQQHLDLNTLTSMPPDGRIPSGKDVSLFVGRNGEVLMYPRDPAPGGIGSLRGIYGLDGSPNDPRGTGLHFFEDGTPRPIAVLPHLVTSIDPIGGIDVALPSGAREHWWFDSTDGFIRRQQDYAYAGRGYDTPSERLGHVPSGALGASPNAPTRDGRFGNLTTSPDGLSTPNVDRPATATGIKPQRYLSGRLAPTPGFSRSDAGAEAVPFDNNPLVPDSAVVAAPVWEHSTTQKYPRLEQPFRCAELRWCQAGRSFDAGHYNPVAGAKRLAASACRPSAGARVSDASTAVGLRSAGSRRRQHGRLVQPLDQAAL